MYLDILLTRAGRFRVIHSTLLSSSTALRFATLTARLEESQLRELCKRMRAPNQHRELALMCCQYGEDATLITARATLELLEHTDAWRRPERFEDFLSACGTACELSSERAQQLRKALALSLQVDTQPWREAGLSGPEIGANIRRERLRRLLELHNR